MLRSVFIFLVAYLPYSTFAQVSTPLTAEIAEVDVREVPDFGPNIMVKNECQTSSTSGEINWGEIVNIGRDIWELIQANKPVVHMEVPVAHALPRGLTCWSQLAGWQAPITRSYEVIYKNLLRIEVVKFRFRLHYTYGGSYQGQGRYLTNVTVLPADLSVAWAYSFNADILVNRAINLGSEKDPVAGLELNLRWNVKTALKESINTVHFFVDGNGNVQFGN